MKRKIFTYLVVSFFVVLFVLSCKKKGDDDDDIYKGLSENIQNIVPDSILAIMLDLGMPINRGTSPPDLTGSYIASPFVLDTSNISYDYSGKLFADFLFKFYNQNNTNQTIEIDYENGPETGTGLGGFISGESNSFSAFLSLDIDISGDPADALFVLTGTISDEGILNFYYANFMVNNYGNPHGYYIEEGEGRIIYDSDGLSPTTTLIKTTESKGGGGVSK